MSRILRKGGKSFDLGQDGIRGGGSDEWRAVFAVVRGEVIDFANKLFDGVEESPANRFVSGQGKEAFDH